MDLGINHYEVLGLPSGEEGAKLSVKQISKAYKLKALELHPDKRPDDLNAHENFQRLKISYEILKNDNSRKQIDDFHHQINVDRRSRYDSKRRKMMSDLMSDIQERERAAFARDFTRKTQGEERIHKNIQEEVARIRSMYGSGPVFPMQEPGEDATEVGRGKENMGCGYDSGFRLDKEKMLKVSWKICDGDYSVERLKEAFEKFGVVEDLIKSSKKRGLALVVMASKEAAVAASENVCGDISNPLVVLHFPTNRFGNKAPRL